MGNALVGVVLCVGVGLWLWLYLRYGREPAVAPQPDYLEDPPYGWTPIELARVWNSEGVQYKDFVAVLLDLTRRGVLSLQAEPVTVMVAEGLAGVEQEYEYSIIRDPASFEQLTEAERYLVEKVLLLEAPGQWISFRRLLVEGTRNAPAFDALFDQWADLVEKEPPLMPLRDPTSATARRYAVLLGICMLLYTYPLSFLKTPFAVSVFAVGAVLIAASAAIERPDPEAALARAKWEAYRRHLVDHTSLATDPPHSVAMWGRHAVYAVTLGVARKIVEAFEWSWSLYG